MAGLVRNPRPHGTAIRLAAQYLPVVPILVCFPIASPSAHGDSLRDDWVDPDTGHRVTRLSRLPGESESFYFHQNAFTADGDKMVFANTDTNHSRDFYVLDWKTRAIEKLTDGGTNRGEVVAAKGRRLYYMRDGEVFEVSLKSKVQSPKSKVPEATRLITRLPPGWRGLTVNAEETLLAGAFGEGAAEISRGQPRSYWFKAIHDAKLPHLLFTIEIATGKTNVFYRGNDWFNHVQFSPTDPPVLMFCHEGPWHEVDRIWTIGVPLSCYSSSLAAPKSDEGGSSISFISAGESDVLQPHLMHRRTIPGEIAGHEFWSPDGKRIWFDLQMPRGEKFFLASTPVAADVRRLHNSGGSPASENDQGRLTSAATFKYELPRDQWSVHFNISHDGKLFAGDGGAPNMVAHAENGKWIYLFTPQPDGTLKAEKLVNMSRHDYALEPNVNFTPDGKWIVFRGNFDDSSQVYAVEVTKAEAGK
jgi:oligogalacturonide lyase